MYSTILGLNTTGIRVATNRIAVPDNLVHRMGRFCLANCLCGDARAEKRLAFPYRNEMERQDKIRSSILSFRIPLAYEFHYWSNSIHHFCCSCHLVLHFNLRLKWKRVHLQRILVALEISFGFHRFWVVFDCIGSVYSSNFRILPQEIRISKQKQ